MKPLEKAIVKYGLESVSPLDLEKIDGLIRRKAGSAFAEKMNQPQKEEKAKRLSRECYDLFLQQMPLRLADVSIINTHAPGLEKLAIPPSVLKKVQFISDREGWSSSSLEAYEFYLFERDAQSPEMIAFKNEYLKSCSKETKLKLMFDASLLNRKLELKMSTCLRGLRKELETEYFFENLVQDLVQAIYEIIQEEFDLKVEHNQLEKSK